MNTFQPNSATTVTSSEDKPALHNNFYAPISEMDPLVKRKGGDPVKYKFGCALFSMSEPGDVTSYKEVIDLCLEGKYLQGIKQTNFTQAGDLRIYLEWMEIIEDKAPSEDPEGIPAEDAGKGGKKRAGKKAPKTKVKKEEVEEEAPLVEEPTVLLDFAAGDTPGMPI